MADVEAPIAHDLGGDTPKRKYEPVTEEELAKEVEEYKKTSFFGRIFCILPKEQYRVALFTCMFCLISFAYSFLRMFKDSVVYSILDSTETKNWLKLLTFVVTQILVIISQNLSAGTNFNHAFGRLTLFFVSLLGLNAALILGVKWLPLHDNLADHLFISDTMTVRGLNALYPLFLVIDQFIYSIFYVLSEVIGSMTVSFCFMTYVNNNCTSGQMKRFVKTLLFFSNISACISGLSYDAWNKYYRERPKAESDIYYVIFPVIVIVFYLIVLAIKPVLEREMTQNPIVITSGAPKKTGPKKKKVSMKDSIYLMVSSKFLSSMCALAFFYNFSSNIFDTANAAGMSASAYALGYERPSSYATGFKSKDLVGTSIATCLIVISSISSLPEKYGIAPFAAVPLVVCLVSSYITCWFSITNFPATGENNMWPFANHDQDRKYFYAESVIGTIIQALIKIAKYAFYDIIKEALAMMIDPVIRPLYKGVFDGSITKFGKFIGSFYGILMGFILGSSDCRYYFTISTILITVLCIVWVFPILYLSKSYKKAKAENTFMDPGMPLSEIKI